VEKKAPDAAGRAAPGPTAWDSGEARERARGSEDRNEKSLACGATDAWGARAPGAGADEAGPGPGSWALSLRRQLSNPHDAAILSLAGPSLIALAADPLLSMVDTAFVGHISAAALGALGVNTALFSFSFLIFNFLGTATTPMIARAAAKGDKKLAGSLAWQSLGIAAGLGVVSAAVLHTFAEPLLCGMGADPSQPEMFGLAKDYLLIRSLAAPAVFIMMAGQGAFRGMKDTATPLAVTLAANAINFTLDLVFIMGMHYGVAGAGAATAIAEWVAAGMYVSALARSPSLQFWAPPEGPSLRAGIEEQRAFLAAGGALLMRTALLLGTKTLATTAATKLGTVPVAAHQVVSQLWTLASLLVDSLAVAGQALVATELGQNRPRVAREVSDRLLTLGLAMGGVLAIGATALSPVLPKLFTTDPDVAAAVSAVFPVAVASLPINALVYVLDGIMVGASEFSFMAAAMVGTAGVTAGALFATESAGGSLRDIWLCLCLLMAGRAGTLYWRYRSGEGALGPVLEGGDDLALAAHQDQQGPGERVRGAVANGEVVPNGAHVNGSAVVNGTAVNGTAVNGTAVNGVAMNGTAVNGVAVSGVAVNGAVVYKSLHEDDHEALLETDPVALLEQQALREEEWGALLQSSAPQASSENLTTGV